MGLLAFKASLDTAGNLRSLGVEDRTQWAVLKHYRNQFKFTKLLAIVSQGILVEEPLFTEAASTSSRLVAICCVTSTTSRLGFPVNFPTRPFALDAFRLCF
jgi:hypothetical protein